MGQKDADRDSTVILTSLEARTFLPTLDCRLLVLLIVSISSDFFVPNLSCIAPLVAQAQKLTSAHGLFQYL
jgi:hypothetical protein